MHFLVLQKLARVPLKNRFRLATLLLLFPVIANIFWRFRVAYILYHYRIFRATDLQIYSEKFSDCFHVVSPWFPTVPRGYPWLSLDILGYPWLSLDILGFLWLYLVILVYTWLSTIQIYVKSFAHLQLFFPSFAEIFFSCGQIIWHEVTRYNQV